MKKFYSFLPLTILLILILASSAAVYNSSTRQNFSKDDLSNSLQTKKFRYRLNLPEFSLPLLYDDNKFFTLNDLKNDKNRYSLINFFASWCTTCLAEHNILMRLKNTESINFYGIAWHDFEDSTTIFLEQNGNPFDIVAIDSKGLFTKIIGIKAVPETILVDSLGKVVLRYQGNLDEEIVYEILNIANAKR